MGGDASLIVPDKMFQTFIFKLHLTRLITHQPDTSNAFECQNILSLTEPSDKYRMGSKKEGRGGGK